MSLDIPTDRVDLQRGASAPELDAAAHAVDLDVGCLAGVRHIARSRLELNRSDPRNTSKRC